MNQAKNINALEDTLSKSIALLDKLLEKVDKSIEEGGLLLSLEYNSVTVFVDEIKTLYQLVYKG